MIVTIVIAIVIVVIIVIVNVCVASLKQNWFLRTEVSWGLYQDVRGCYRDYLDIFPHEPARSSKITAFTTGAWI